MAGRLGRLGAAAVIAGIATVGLGMASPTAGALPYPGPEPDCGLVYHEAGILSKTIHSLEPVLVPLRANLTLHELNCSYVVSLETTLGLQAKPGFPGGPFG
jgi:hypothetical protein